MRGCQYYEAMSVDVLLFGAHPDDIEWGAGGICLLLGQNKLKFALADLTRGELGSRGNADQRDGEALQAAEFIGATERENLMMPDGGLVDTPSSRRRIASVIRRHRPTLVLAPYWKDRHPDHTATGKMVRNAQLYCTLRKSDDPHPPHKPALVLYYLLHHYERPNVVIDISAFYEEKLKALRLHQSQFAQTATQLGVIPMGMSDYLFGLESRDRFFGLLIGAKHGEALVSAGPMSVMQATILSRFLSPR